MSTTSQIPQLVFHKEDVLLNRLASLARNSKKLVFVVGSPLTAPESANSPGVPDVKGMLQLIENTYLDDPEAQESLKQILASKPQNPYQAAFEHLHGYRGQDSVNQVITQAILRAYNSSQSEQAIIDAIDDDECEKLEGNLEKWHLRHGVDALGEIITNLPDTFGQSVITSNFDPLIEISTRRHGGKSFRTVLHSDGNLDQTVGAEGCRVIHFHGYWYGADTLHTPIQLGQPRPRLEASLRELLKSRTVLVLAYGGWDDIFTTALVNIVQDDRAKADILWAFYESDEPRIQTSYASLIKNLLPGISRGRVTLFKSIDAHSFLPSLKNKLIPKTIANKFSSGDSASLSVATTQDATEREALINQVANLFDLSGHKSKTALEIGGTRIDVLAEEQHGLVRKTIIAICRTAQTLVSKDDIEQDIRRLQRARSSLGTSILMHISQGGHSPEAKTYARGKDIEIFTPAELAHRLINFDAYINAIRKEPSRQAILREYQHTTIHYEGEKRSTPKSALEFLTSWVAGPQRWLTILGDYGVGKSWMLKRLLYELIEDYHKHPLEKPLPLFVPLQRFTKAFTFQNLMLALFQNYGLTGVHYPAFEHLASQGRILFLFDSFDEMAQTLRRETIRENLKELLSGITAGSKAIMTSRPTYFESRAERLTQDNEIHDNSLVWHQADQEVLKHQTALSRTIDDQLRSSRFARLNDLTNEQRLRLFSVVLKGKPKAHAKLLELHERFKLDSISQRAVIARLLTTVAETLADEGTVLTPDEYILLPSQLTELNQAKVFQIIVTNLLRRDNQIGQLNAVDRLRFLRSLAIYLQRPGNDFFAAPNEIRGLVERLFKKYIQSSDTPQQLLENFYRTCRRHSGLTTEGQFLDTSGNIDTPVDERDFESRVGFSHNSLREYLVADAISDHLLKGIDYPDLSSTTITPVVGDLLVEISTYEQELVSCIKKAYQSAPDSKTREWWFRVIYSFITKKKKDYHGMLGEPPCVRDVDVCDLDLSGVDFSGSLIEGCLAEDTDFRNANLSQSKIEGTIISGAMFDGSKLSGADFTKADVQSIFVFDEYERRTSAVLYGRDARQWLYSHGAVVSGQEELNHYLGRPWYEAAREVMRTLAHRLAGTHQDAGLVKGTKLAYRDFAVSFVDYLKNKKVLKNVKKAGSNVGWVVKVTPEHRKTITDFSEKGVISDILKPFFDKHIKD